MRRGGPSRWRTAVRPAFAALSSLPVYGTAWTEVTNRPYDLDDPRYRDLPSAFLLPHIGSATIDTRNAMGFLLLDGLEALEEGRRPPNQVA